MNIAVLLQAMIVLFPISEIALAFFKRAHAEAAVVQDRGSLLLLWLSIFVGVGAGVALQRLPGGHLPITAGSLRVVALLFFTVGLGIRWAAILALGRLFTVNVAVHADHRIVDTGLYRYVRHPSYSGLLLAFVGLGLTYGSWYSLLGLLTPIAFGLANRIATEERALRSLLGPAYVAYSARTRRLIPGIL